VTGSTRRRRSATVERAASGTRPKARARTSASDATRAVDILARFRIIFRSARQHYLAIERQLGISGAQLRALAIIAAHEGDGVTALARALHVRQPTASRLVEQLVALGHVRRRRSANDQRAIELAATTRGRRLLARTPGPLAGVLADALESLPRHRLAQLGQRLDEVLEAMRLRDDRASYLPLSDL